MRNSYLAISTQGLPIPKGSYATKRKLSFDE